MQKVGESILYKVLITSFGLISFQKFVKLLAFTKELYVFVFLSILLKFQVKHMFQILNISL